MHDDPQIDTKSLTLMQALLERSGVAAAAQQAFRQAYPDAPQAMIDAAVHHVVSEGMEAAVDWLAAIERFIRDPSVKLDYGAVWHVIYHLYNWQQLQTLMPLGREGFKEQLQDIRQLIEDDDKETALKVLKQLSGAIDGDISPPDIR